MSFFDMTLNNFTPNNNNNFSLLWSQFSNLLKPSHSSMFSKSLFNYNYSYNYNYSGFTNTRNPINKALGEIGQTGGTKYGEPGKWCAAFASWAFGGNNAPWGNQHSVAGIKTWAQKHGVYQQGSNPQNIKPGDLVIWRPESNNKGQSHVAIVTGVENGKIKTVEGNSGNKVRTREYAFGTRFDGFVKVS